MLRLLCPIKAEWRLPSAGLFSCPAAIDLRSTQNKRGFVFFSRFVGGKEEEKEEEGELDRLSLSWPTQDSV